MKYFSVMHFDLFTSCFAFALLDDHDAPLAHLCPAAQGHEHRARFRGPAARALGSLLSTRLSAGGDEHGAALTVAEVIVNGHRLTAVLRHALWTQSHFEKYSTKTNKRLNENTKYNNHLNEAKLFQTSSFKSVSN